MTLKPALSPSRVTTTTGTTILRGRPRRVSASTAWFMATANMPAPSERVTATCVLSRKKTRAVMARTPKQTVKTVLSVTCEAGRDGPEVAIAPFYRSSRDVVAGRDAPALSARARQRRVPAHQPVEKRYSRSPALSVFPDESYEAPRT